MTRRALKPALYEKLLPVERFQVAVEAMGRADHDELRRLGDSCPEHRYLATDVEYAGRLRAALVVALSAATTLFRARLALESAIARLERLEDAKALIAHAAPDSFDESSLELDEWGELETEIKTNHCARAADLVSVCDGVRLFCESIGVAPSNFLALARDCIPVWELGESLRKEHGSNEEMAGAMHANLTEQWQLMTRS